MQIHVWKETPPQKRRAANSAWHMASEANFQQSQRLGRKSSRLHLEQWCPRSGFIMSPSAFSLSSLTRQGTPPISLAATESHRSSSGILETVLVFQAPCALQRLRVVAPAHESESRRGDTSAVVGTFVEDIKSPQSFAESDRSHRR